MPIPSLALVGKFKDLSLLAEALSDSGISVSIQKTCPLSNRADLILQMIDADSFEMECNRPWMACDLTGSQQAIAKAYQAGARAVFPKGTPADVITQTVLRALEELQHDDLPLKQGWTNHYRRGEVIHLEEDTVLHIEEGVLATTMIHQDGAEVLLGLSGHGQIVVAHPDDNCHIQIVAHTDVKVEIERWEYAASQPEFSQKLRARLQQMEGWAAMQARPHLDQRLMGLLGLLAEQFGIQHDAGMLIDVRITHNQLATAAGATRTSISRVLRDLRALGKLSIISKNGDDRFCLLEKVNKNIHH